jgi:hypothetical protein
VATAFIDAAADQSVAGYSAAAAPSTVAPTEPRPDIEAFTTV